MSAGQSGGMQMFGAKQEIKEALHKTLADFSHNFLPSVVLVRRSCRLRLATH